MLVLIESQGEPPHAVVEIAQDGLIPFCISFPPYRRLGGFAPSYWRPDKGDRQVFEVGYLPQDVSLAEISCVTLREGGRKLPGAMPAFGSEQAICGRPLVFKESEVGASIPRGGIGSRVLSPRPVCEEEPIGVSVAAYRNGLVATWARNVEKCLRVPGDVGLLIGPQSTLIGVAIFDLSASQVAAFLERTHLRSR